MQGANDQVYSDNYLTPRRPARLAVELARAESTSLRIAASRSLAESARLRAQLHQILIPRVDASLARLVAIHQDDPPAELRTIMRIPVAWRRFENLRRAGCTRCELRPGRAGDRERGGRAIVARRSIRS